MLPLPTSILFSGNRLRAPSTRQCPTGPSMAVLASAALRSLHESAVEVSPIFPWTPGTQQGLDHCLDSQGGEREGSWGNVGPGRLCILALPPSQGPQAEDPGVEAEDRHEHCGTLCPDPGPQVSPCVESQHARVCLLMPFPFCGLQGHVETPRPNRYLG